MGMTVEDESIAVIPVEETQCFMRISHLFVFSVSVLSDDFGFVDLGLEEVGSLLVLLGAGLHRLASATKYKHKRNENRFTISIVPENDISTHVSNLYIERRRRKPPQRTFSTTVDKAGLRALRMIYREMRLFRINSGCGHTARIRRRSGWLPRVSRWRS